MEVLLQETEYSSEQYLAIERKAERKSEYINGRIFAIAGASRQHNQITFNIYRENTFKPRNTRNTRKKC